MKSFQLKKMGMNSILCTIGFAGLLFGMHLASADQTTNPLVTPTPHPYTPSATNDQAVTPRLTHAKTITPFSDTRSVKASPNLPLFGYNFFSSARAYVRAQLQNLTNASVPQNQYGRPYAGYGPYQPGFTSGPGTNNPAGPTTTNAPGLATGVPNSNPQTSPNITNNPGQTPNNNQQNPPNVQTSPNTGTNGTQQTASGRQTSVNPQNNPNGQGENAQQNSPIVTTGPNQQTPLNSPYGRASNQPGLYNNPYSPYPNNVNAENQPYGNNPYASTAYPPFGYGQSSGYPSFNSQGVGGFTNGAANYNSSVSAFSGIITPYQQMLYNVVATAPVSYKISAGDTLSIRYSNPAMEPQQIVAPVNSNGRVSLGRFGEVNLSGLEVSQAQAIVKQHLARYFRNLNVTVSLKGLHTISVTVGGEVEAPGTYIVPSVSSAFNLLYAAGGPTRQGSLRDIEIRRNNKTLHLDFYKMIAGASTPIHKGYYEPDVTLQQGDVLYIPDAQERVSVEGEVRNPAIYELIPGETLEEALNLAGGAKAALASNTVQVTTLEPGKERIIKTLDLNNTKSLSSTVLYDGDIVNVLSIRPTVQNLVIVKGAVNQPGDYAYTPGMRLDNLLSDARNLLPEAYLQRAALYRWGSDGVRKIIPINLVQAMRGDPQANIPLTRWDELKVYTQDEASFIGTGIITIRGSVQHPGIYTYDRNMHLSDLLIEAGGPLPDADTVVVEHQHGNGSSRYVIDTIHQISETSSQGDPALQDNDIVAVYSNSESRFIPPHRVTIRGYVVAPGQYDRGEGMRLSDLLRISGGFLPDAGTKVEISHAREVVTEASYEPSSSEQTVVFNSEHQCPPGQDVLLRDGDVVLVDGKGDYQDKPLVVTIYGEVHHPGPYFITPNTRLSELVKMAGGLRKDAFPLGAQLNRDPAQMSSPEQQEIARIVNDLTQVYNASDYKRQVALSDLDKITATNQVSTGGSLLSLGGLSAAAPPNPAAAVLAVDLAKESLVTPARDLNTADLTPSGNIAVKLADAINDPNGPQDILLKAGDVLTVPTIPTTVQVEGAVVNTRSVIWVKGEGVPYYLTNVGGAAPDADLTHMIVIHANGALVPANKAGNLEAGDVIFVPTKVLVAQIASHKNSVGDFLSELTSGAIIFGLAKSALHF